jgi:hypothetical protein
VPAGEIDARLHTLVGASPDLWRRYLAIIFDGLRPQGAHPLPQPPPPAAQI